MLIRINVETDETRQYFVYKSFRRLELQIIFDYAMQFFSILRRKILISTQSQLNGLSLSGSKYFPDEKFIKQEMNCTDGYQASCKLK